MKKIAPFTLAAAISAAAPPALADTLLLDAITQAPENSQRGVPRPVRGQTMDEVYNNFGQPQTEYPPVGDPPITRWVYDKFTVYFEYKRVIDTVVHR
ncbi:MAG TPA: hypothetical protein ENI99_10935 [Sedimenticola sp.]|nr:hypothetical protein [Sedimenticola sp.]